MTFFKRRLGIDVYRPANRSELFVNVIVEWVPAAVPIVPT
jgi:hypothetical protein